MCENAFMKVWVASTGSIFNGGRRVFLTFLSIPPTGQTSSGVVGILLLLFCCSSSKWFACYSSVSVENDTQRDKYGFSFIEAFQTMVRGKEFKKITSEL